MPTKKTKRPERITQTKLQDFIAEYLRQHPTETFNATTAGLAGGQCDTANYASSPPDNSANVRIAQNAAELTVDRLTSNDVTSALLIKRNQLAEELRGNERAFKQLEHEMSVLGSRMAHRREEHLQLTKALAALVS